MRTRTVISIVLLLAVIVIAGVMGVIVMNNAVIR